MTNSPMKPDETRIEELLGKIQPVPGEAFHQKIKRAAWCRPDQQVAKGIRAKTAFAVVALLLFAAMFVTPQGRAWAQELLQFFRKVNFTSIPVSEEERNSFNTVPEQYELPLVPVLLPTLEPEMESLNECQPPHDIQSYACQVAYAEKKLGMQLQEFAQTPEHWIFKEIRFDAVSKNAAIVYTHDSEHGADLTLRQGTGDFQSNFWDIVPAEEVEIVQVGGFAGEYVEGVFSLTEGDTAWRWSDDDTVQRLAWSDGQRWYYLESWPPSPGYMSRDEFIVLASSLVDRPAERDDVLNPESLSSVADAEEYSGLDLKAPTVLPLGYEFSYARYFPVNHEIHLHYDAGADDLVIYEWKGKPEDFAALATYYKEHELVQVGDRPAFYGVPAAVAEYEATYLTLAWHDAGMNYRIFFYFNPDWGGGLLDQEKMIRIAESMADINAVKVYASKPYEYVSVYEQALGFDVKEFSETPDGWVFGDVSAVVPLKCIVLSYGLQEENGGLHLQQCQTNMDAYYYDQRDIPRNAIETVRIGENQGRYLSGKAEVGENGETVWNRAAPYRTLLWEQDGFWMQLMVSGDGVLLYDKDDLIRYAESLR